MSEGDWRKVERNQPSTQSEKPKVIWREDLPDPTRQPPRTDPPRHAENAANALYERVAIQPPPRPRSRFRPTGIASGSALLLIAGIIFAFDWDAALLRLPSVALAAFGLLRLLKGLLGYR